MSEEARVGLLERQHAYKTTFKGPVAAAVMMDLAFFCRANESTFHDDPRVSAKLDGRREVWLRIQQHLKLTPDQLWELLR